MILQCSTLHHWKEEGSGIILIPDLLPDTLGHRSCEWFFATETGEKKTADAPEPCVFERNFEGVPGGLPPWDHHHREEEIPLHRWTPLPGKCTDFGPSPVGRNLNNILRYVNI